jgi:2-polyprenyl-3-methyl-5-hydroxy-6-metoxy-1,4-benzoquinol methylase
VRVPTPQVREVNAFVTTVLEHPTGKALVTELADGRKRLQAIPTNRNLFVQRTTCKTRYPLDLIQTILDVKEIGSLCDEISRDEDPTYVQRDLELGLLSYVSASAFEGKRILDFGCGSGASTSVLARMFPESHIVGTELSKEFLAVARQRLQYYGLSNVNLSHSPSGTDLQEGIGAFDFIILSAVFEHLLPQEREILVPKLWSVLKEDGYLFINQTPNRLWLIENHTTGLPLLNYAPNWLALEAARRCRFGPAKRYSPDSSWEFLLREGIRGGTKDEILTYLTNDSYSPVSLEPCRLGFRDNIDLWYSSSVPRGKRPVKAIMKGVYKAIKKATNLDLSPWLTLAFKKARTTR